MQEKLPLATAQDYGQSLSAVRHLQEKHQVLANAGRGCLQKQAGLTDKGYALWPS